MNSYNTQVFQDDGKVVFNAKNNCLRGLVPLRVLKSKMSTIRVIPVPFRVFYGEKYDRN